MGNYLGYTRLVSEVESDCEKNQYCKKQKSGKNDIKCECKIIKELLDQESERIRNLSS